MQKHDVNIFGYYIKYSYDDKLSVYKSQTGMNCAQVFMQSTKNYF